LILTVLSQATEDINSARAFRNLQKRFQVTPDALSKTDVKEFEETIWVGGLYRNKAKVIKAISNLILEQHNGTLDFIYSLPFEDARSTLLEIPGVGPKTAHIVLLFCTNKQTIPVDTHFNRVSKRLELVPAKADYEGYVRAWRAFTSQ